jgi:hypothetical protein
VPIVGASGGSVISGARLVTSRCDAVARRPRQWHRTHGSALARRSHSSRGGRRSPAQRYSRSGRLGNDWPSGRPLQAGLRLPPTAGLRLSST